jgi:hypothetical protein
VLGLLLDPEDKSDMFVSLKQWLTFNRVYGVVPQDRIELLSRLQWQMQGRTVKVRRGESYRYSHAWNFFPFLKESVNNGENFIAIP